jgi:hypothetical protein
MLRQANEKLPSHQESFTLSEWTGVLLSEITAPIPENSGFVKLSTEGLNMTVHQAVALAFDE